MNVRRAFVYVLLAALVACGGDDDVHPVPTDTSSDGGLAQGDAAPEGG